MCEELNKGIMELLEQIKGSEVDGTVPVDEEIVSALLLFRKLHEDILHLSQSTVDKYATWCDTELLGNDPYNPKLIMTGIYRMLADRFQVPISWVACVPMHIQTNSTNVTLNVCGDDNPHFFTSKGNATEVYYGAFVDAVDTGLIPKDSCFLYERTPEAITFSKEVGDVVGGMEGLLHHFAKSLDDMLSLDMSFPTTEEE